MIMTTCDLCRAPAKWSLTPADGSDREQLSCHRHLGRICERLAKSAGVRYDIRLIVPRHSTRNREAVSTPLRADSALRGADGPEGPEASPGTEDANTSSRPEESEE